MAVKFAGNLLTEFKNFALKGNMVDLAVAVIIGGAFGKVVGSLVENIFMPAIAAAIGTDPVKSYRGWEWMGIRYGMFIADLFNFLVVALAVFIAVVKVLGFLMNMRKKEAVEPTAPAAVPEDIKLLTEIRDLLGAQQKPPVM